MSFFKQAVDMALSLSENSNQSYIQDIPLEVISEKTRSLPMTLPTKRVENGFNISDSVRKEPMIINITVVDNSRDYLLNRDKLMKLQELGEEVQFVFSNRDTYEHMIIENIEEMETGEQKFGFTYYITLRQIQVGEIKETDVKMDSKKAQTSGGKKKRTTAKVSTPTSAEKSKVNKVVGVSIGDNLGKALKGINKCLNSITKAQLEEIKKYK
ncbi:phage baseplate protein [Fusobacterium animalis]|uniref:phage baseplate protein n=1 Tax=Fusobacterium animalis TaxID=76859 RepID=UPI0035561586